MTLGNSKSAKNSSSITTSSAFGPSLDSSFGLCWPFLDVGRLSSSIFIGSGLFPFFPSCGFVAGFGFSWSTT